MPEVREGAGDRDQIPNQRLGFLTHGSGLTPLGACTEPALAGFFYHRDLSTRYSLLSAFYSGVECSAAETKLVDLMVSSRKTRDADAGSRR